MRLQKISIDRIDTGRAEKRTYFSGIRFIVDFCLCNEPSDGRTLFRHKQLTFWRINASCRPCFTCSLVNIWLNCFWMITLGICVFTSLKISSISSVKKSEYFVSFGVVFMFNGLGSGVLVANLTRIGSLHGLAMTVFWIGELIALVFALNALPLIPSLIYVLLYSGQPQHLQDSKCNLYKTFGQNNCV